MGIVASNMLLATAEAGDLDVVKKLVRDGADVNAKTRMGETALMKAAICGHIEVVRYLAGECGADANTTNKYGETALINAARYGQREVVRYLARECGADVNARDDIGETALMKASYRGHFEVVRFLAGECDADVNAANNTGWTAVMNAARPGHIDVVRYLAGECGADVNATNINGWTALMKAAREGHTDVVRYLVKKHGAKVNITDKDGISPIRMAAERGHQDTVRFLKTFLMHSKASLPAVSSSNSLLSDQKSSWIIPPCEIALTQFVNTSNFGGEYLAKWLDADVSVKLFIPDAAQSSFEKEIQLWQKLRHPNVIRMYGACEASPEVQFFVCEYASNGSLIEHVESASEERHTWKYLYEAALGLEYLHERGILHGDLRCSNILIGSDGLSKLSNFGLSGKKRTSKTVVSMRWQAPEVLYGDESSPFASDVYSLGMCILEAVTRKKPWDDCAKDDYVRWKKLEWTPERRQNDLNSPYSPCTTAPNFVWRMCCQDPAKRMKLQSVVYELAQLTIMEGSKDVEPEHEPLLTLRDYNYGKANNLWRKVENLVEQSANVQYLQIFDELKALYERLQDSTQSITLLTRFHSLLAEFHAVITMTPKQSLAMQLSSTRATTNSIYSFHRRIQSLWTLIDRPGAYAIERVDRWEKQHRELFVSGITDVYLQLKDVKSDEEKAAFLKTLKREMTNQYTPAQLETMKKAIEAIENTIEKESLSNLVPEWLIPWYELIKNEDGWLGAGGFGSVFRAKWLDSEVVVKQVELSDSEDKQLVDSWATTSYLSMETDEGDSDDLEVRAKRREDALAMFRREVEIWFGFSHPHVIQLFGACHIGRPFFVCEYATNGTLIEYLRKHPGDLWQKLYEAALGVQYLHARGVVHGDLKGNNIVIGSDMKAKVTDFGLSSVVKDGDKPHVSGAWHWVAPECFSAIPQLTFASDVYSLSMCIVEAMREVGNEECSLPWGKLDNIVVKVHTKQGETPLRPSFCTDAQWELVNRMCVFQPEKRIKISTVVDELSRLAREEEGVTATVDVESSNLGFVSDVVSTSRALLAELHDNNGSEVPMYADLWDELERVLTRIDGVQSSHKCLEVFRCLVKDTEEATLKLQDSKMNLMHSVETIMAVYALRRRLAKFMEAYPADNQ